MSSDVKINPATASQPDGQSIGTNRDGQGAVLFNELHGKWHTGSYRNNVFSANRTAVTAPVVASGLVSVFSLYNPIGSNRNLELIDFDFGVTTVTEVVNTIGLYWQGSPLAQSATFTTVGVQGTNLFSGAPANGAGPQGRFYSAATHSGTPVRIRVLGTVVATAVPIGQSVHYEFDGKVLLFPGDLVSVAMSTGAYANVDLGISWAEWPF